MTESPLFVIVHHRDNGRRVEDQVYDIRPDSDLPEVRGRAAELQHDANVRYGRPNDTYRVAELRYVDEEG